MSRQTSAVMIRPVVTCCQDCGAPLKPPHTSRDCPVCQRLVLSHHATWLCLVGMS